MIWIAGADRLKLESKTPGIGLALGKSVFGGVCIKAEIRHSIVSGDFAEKFSEFILPISNYSLQVINKNIRLTSWLCSKSKKKKKKKKKKRPAPVGMAVVSYVVNLKICRILIWCFFVTLNI